MLILPYWTILLSWLFRFYTTFLKLYLYLCIFIFFKGSSFIMTKTWRLDFRSFVYLLWTDVFSVCLSLFLFPSTHSVYSLHEQYNLLNCSYSDALAGAVSESALGGTSYGSALLALQVLALNVSENLRNSLSSRVTGAALLSHSDSKAELINSKTVFYSEVKYVCVCVLPIALTAMSLLVSLCYPNLLLCTLGM